MTGLDDRMGHSGGEMNNEDGDSVDVRPEEDRDLQRAVQPDGKSDDTALLGA